MNNDQDLIEASAGDGIEIDIAMLKERKEKTLQLLEVLIPKTAKFLDRLLPDWPEAVDCDQLDMTLQNFCINGQLFGLEVHSELRANNDFLVALGYSRIDSAGNKLWYYGEDKEKHRESGTDEVFCFMQELWVNEITKRRKNES